MCNKAQYETEGQALLYYFPLREKKTYLKMFRELEKSFPSDECFLDRKKSKTSRPPLAGQQNLRFVQRMGPMEKKESVD